MHPNGLPDEGEIVTAYGETLGHYANWSGVSTGTIREINGLRYGTPLLPGDRIVVPLDIVRPEEFNRLRMEFHRSREEDFYSYYAINEVAQMKVRRGDTVWSIAQGNNVPMWLFYQQNPELIGRPFRAGSKVYLPLIEEITEMEREEPHPTTGQAG